MIGQVSEKPAKKMQQLNNQDITKGRTPYLTIHTINMWDIYQFLYSHSSRDNVPREPQPFQATKHHRHYHRTCSVKVLPWQLLIDMTEQFRSGQMVAVQHDEIKECQKERESSRK